MAFLNTSKDKQALHLPTLQFMLNRLRFPLQNIWRLLFFLNTFISLVPLYPFFLVFVNDEKHFTKAFKLKKIWAWLMLAPLGISWKAELEEELGDGPYILCANHTSYLDIIVSYLTFPVYYHYLGKVELTKWYLFNIFFKKMNIPIDREHSRKAYSALDRAKADLQKGISIAIYPEGTVSPNAPKLSRFKSGAFRLAIDSQVPIVPITFLYNWDILPRRRNRYKGGRPGLSVVRIHKPISTVGMTSKDYETLRLQVIDTISTELRGRGFEA